MFYKQPKTKRVCTKPRSLLQDITCQAHWAINYSLQKFHLGTVRDLYLNKDTLLAIAQRNALTDELKSLIKRDLKIHKAAILLERKTGGPF